MTLWKYGQ